MHDLFTLILFVLYSIKGQGINQNVQTNWGQKLGQICTPNNANLC